MENHTNITSILEQITEWTEVPSDQTWQKFKEVDVGSWWYGKHSKDNLTLLEAIALREHGCTLTYEKSINDDTFGVRVTIKPYKDFDIDEFIKIINSLMTPDYYL